MKKIRLKERKYSDSELVKGVLENDRKISQQFYNQLKSYYDRTHAKFFQVDEEAAQVIFQMAMKAIVTHIKSRKISVNADELIGPNGQPLKPVLTSYFIDYTKRTYKEWLRLQGRKTNSFSEDLPDLEEEPSFRGSDVPYEKEENGKYYWFINGVSTGIEVKRGNQNSGMNKQIPYIGTNAHWWIDDEGEVKDLGPMYSNFFYDDQDLIKLTAVARVIADMRSTCKRLLTLFYYYEKNYDEIMSLMTDFNSWESLKTKKSNCLKTLRQFTDEMHD